MERREHFDIIVLGGGPGGYPAAIKAAQLGKRVALVEAKELGGTCLNRGCIPTKTLIANAETLQAIRSADSFGIETGPVTFDYGKMVARKNDVVAGLSKSLEQLVLSNHISLFHGFGKFSGPNEIKVLGKDNILLTADKIIIATGSEPRNFPAFPFDGKYIHDSTSLLELTTLPKRLIIVGGGVIGCEFASLYNAFDVDVTIVELMPRILPMECSNLSRKLSQAFEKKGIFIETEAMVEKVDVVDGGVTVTLASGKMLSADIALIAVGRRLNTSGIGLDRAGVAVDPDGIIPVNDKMETNVKTIYAIGDIASRFWLAHVASHQGLVAGQNAAGVAARMHYNAIPSVIFTEPEIATVGLTLEQALSQGLQATLTAYPFQALGKAQAALQTEGFAQIVIEKRTKQILGAQVLGHNAGTLIAEMGVAIANELTVESIIETVHAHPTIAEVWLEAALIANHMPLHAAPKRVRDCATIN